MEGNYPIDRNQHTLQEFQCQMKGEPKAVSQMIAVEDQIMSLKMVQRFFNKTMLTARHYHKKCARTILDGRYSLKQLEFIESERRSRVSSLEAHRELTFLATSYIYMFVVSGHLYRPLLLSQPWELKGKIKSGIGTPPQRF